MPALAGERFDLDRALADFRHFALEQALDQFRMRTAEDDLHRAGRIAHLQDQRLNALAGLVRFAGDLLAARHDAFDVPVQRDDHRRAFEAGDRARDDRADAVLVFLVNRSALVLPDELDHHLLHRLCADSTHDRQRQLLLLAIRLRGTP